ncbi:hypothetical protein [Phytohabitans aurantiacus]|uniref:Baseplate protein J-like domain-containing protein n=1 Tax=Phytohabitans aurantiacus TaxID=3016789 RepID=A0ABQ5R3C2_9ACTN|nr:hypothetical protein [Phytohabitans aurantiacus]GLI01031.1 hypothetical protein Pa4123_63070 [Phytohabitans aurantiacus]
MANYDAVLGTDELALNEFVRTVYDAAHDRLLKGTVPVSLPPLTVTAIEYDIASAPVVALRPSALVRQHREEQLRQLAGLTDQDIVAGAAAESRASFELTVDRLVAVVHYAGDPEPTQIEASVRAGLQLIVVSGGVMTPDLVTLTINIPDNPDLAEIVNRGLGPELIRLIEQNFLFPIQIPPIGLGNLQVASPVVATGDGRLLATTSVLPEQPDPAPLAGGWPDGTVFVAVLPKVLNGLLNEATAGQEITGHWEKRFDFFLFSITLKADFRARISEISIELVPGQKGQLHGAARVDVDVHFWAKNLTSFSATGVARPTVHATAAVNAANEVTVDLDSIDAISFDLDFKGVPAILDNLLETIVNGMAPLIIAAVRGEVAKLPPQPVTQIPELPIVLDGTTLVVTLKNVALTTLTTPDGKPCLAATGGAAVQVNPQTVKHTLVRAA